MAVIGGRAHSLTQIRELSELGYPFAEISLYDPETVARELPELRALQSQYGISYLAHYPNEDNPRDAAVLKERFVPRIKKLLALTRDLGIQKGTFHFWLDRRWCPAELLGRKIELLAQMTEYAVTMGVTFCIENLSERWESFRPAFEDIPSLMMTLDIGHAQLLSEENTSFGFIAACFERIAHVHVHDNRGGTSVKDDLHLPLGEGTVDYARIFTLLREKGYDSTLTMELKPFEMAATRDLIRRYLP